MHVHVHVYMYNTPKLIWSSSLPLSVCALQEVGVGGTCAWRLCGVDPSTTINVIFEVANQVHCHVHLHVHVNMKLMLYICSTTLYTLSCCFHIGTLRVISCRCTYTHSRVMTCDSLSCPIASKQHPPGAARCCPVHLLLPAPVWPEEGASHHRCQAVSESSQGAGSWWGGRYV